MYGPTWSFLLILIVYGPGVVFVKHWDTLPCDWDMLYFGWSSSYKGDSTRFSRVVSGYLTSTSILRVDGLLTDPREMGRHTHS